MLIKKHHEDKLASHRQEKIWQHVILDKEMLSRIYKKFHKLITKKQTISLLKWTKDLN